MCLTLLTWFRFLKVKELQFSTPSNPLISEAPYSSNLIFNGWNWGFSSLHNHYSLISHFNSNNGIIIVVVAVICLKWPTFSGYDKLFYKFCIALAGIQTCSAVKWNLSSWFSWSIVFWYLKLHALDWLWKEAVQLVNGWDMRSTIII